MEWDPRNGGNTAWVTYLESGGSSKLVKITLQDGPNYTAGNRVLTSALPGSALGQNYPNPFNPSTVVPFTVPMAADAEIEVLDELGRVVLQSTEHVDAGEHVRQLDCRTLPSGSYIYELRVNGMLVASRRMTLMK
jgi:hypothetical protein